MSTTPSMSRPSFRAPGQSTLDDIGTKSLTLRIPPPAYRTLKDEAERTHRSLASLLVELLEDGWKLYAQRAELRARSVGRGVAQARADVVALAGTAPIAPAPAAPPAAPATAPATAPTPATTASGSEPAPSGAADFGV